MKIIIATYLIQWALKMIPNQAPGRIKLAMGMYEVTGWALGQYKQAAKAKGDA